MAVTDPVVEPIELTGERPLESDRSPAGEVAIAVAGLTVAHLRWNASSASLSNGGPHREVADGAHPAALRSCKSAGQRLFLGARTTTLEHMFPIGSGAPGGQVADLDPGAVDDLALAAWATDLERRRTLLDAEEAAVLGELDAREVCFAAFGLKTGTVAGP